MGQAGGGDARWAQVAAVLFGAVGVWAFFAYLLPLALPLVAALLLSLAIEPAVRRLEAWGIPRSLGAAACLLGALGLAALALAWTASRLASEAGELARRLPQARRLVEELVGSVRVLRKLVPASLLDHLAPAGYLAGLAQALVRQAAGLVAGLPHAFFFLIVAVLAAYFLSRDGPHLTATLRRRLPQSWFGPLDRVKADVLRSAAGLVQAQLVLMAATAGSVAAGLWLLGQRYALLLGLLAGLLDLVPGVGPAGVLVPWAALALLRGPRLLALQLLVLLAVVALLRELLEVRVVGRGVGLHPLATLAALYVGMRLFGPAGVLYGPLGAVALQALWRAVAAGR